MTDHLRAIETTYLGYRFRSRLEARWAAFLTRLGVKFEYESEGYDLNGTRYLPDFWLPGNRTFIEVKAQRGDGVDRKPLAAVEAAPNLFSRDSDNPHHMVIVYGDPLNGDSDEIRWFGETWVSKAGFPRVCPWCHQISFSGRRSTRATWTSDCACGSLELPERQAFVTDAALAARQARFEFGDGPRDAAQVTHQWHDVAPNIYLAGKIRGDDWRKALGVPDGEATEKGGDRFLVGGQIRSRYRSWTYHGPDLSLMHSEIMHGIADDCLRRVLSSNTLFTWIDDANVHGTMAELGAWHGYGGGGISGPSFVGFSSKELRSEVWFAASLATMSVVVPTARQAWDAFVEWEEYDRCYQMAGA